MLKTWRKASFDVRKALNRNGQDEDLDVLAAHAHNVEKARKQCLMFVKHTAEFVKNLEATNEALGDVYPEGQELEPLVRRLATEPMPAATNSAHLDKLRALVESRCAEVSSTIRATKDMVNGRNLKSSELNHYHSKLRKLEGSAKEKDVDRMARNKAKADEMAAALKAETAEVRVTMGELDRVVAASLHEMVLAVAELQNTFFAQMAKCASEALAMPALPQPAAGAGAGVVHVSAPHGTPSALASPSSSTTDASADGTAPPPPLPTIRRGSLPPPETTARRSSDAAPPGVGNAGPTSRNRGLSTPARTHAGATAAALASSPLASPTGPVVDAAGAGAGAGAATGASAAAVSLTPHLPFPAPPPPPTAPAPPIQHRTYVACPLLARTGNRSSFSGGSMAGNSTPTPTTPRSAGVPPPPLPSGRHRRTVSATDREPP